MAEYKSEDDDFEDSVSDCNQHRRRRGRRSRKDKVDTPDPREQSLSPNCWNAPRNSTDFLISDFYERDNAPKKARLKEAESVNSSVDEASCPSTSQPKINSPCSIESSEDLSSPIGEEDQDSADEADFKNALMALYAKQADLMTREELANAYILNYKEKSKFREQIEKIKKENQLLKRELEKTKESEHFTPEQNCT